MACPGAEVLTAFATGELADAARATVADHAAWCAECHAILAAFGDPSEGPLRPGTRVGRYVLEERLGMGGMGVVYAATDEELQRRVALKVLRPEHADDERLRREARTLARLSHPNIVTVFDVGRHGEQLFVAMELVEGGSLDAWLRRAPRSFAEIFARACEAGAGLAAAHAAGFVHRDIKPENILVGADGHARVTDFGLAREDATATGPVAGVAPAVTNAIVGTPMYMAPEQLAGGRADARSDQWAFFATLYEAVAGVRPFAFDTIPARRTAIEHGELSTGRRVPGWLRRIVRRGLHVDPSRRWPSMAAAVTSLVRGRRRPRRIAIGAAAVIGLAALSLAMKSAPTPSPDPTIMREADSRGCNCPYARCVAGRCVGACRDVIGFRRGAPLPGLHVEGHQDAMQGVARDGNTLLMVTGERCSIDRLVLAHRRNGTFVPVDLTDRLNARLGPITYTEACCTLAPDGRSLLVRSADQRTFIRVVLDGDEIAAVDRDELAQLAPQLAGDARVTSPVLTADQRTIYFSIRDWVANDVGPLDGNYSSTRSDPRAAFPRATRMPGRARSYGYPTGVTDDQLTLFMASEYQTRVLMRETTNEPFGDPLPNGNPPTLIGWRAVPLDGCERLITTYTPGGCAAETTVEYRAIHAD